MFHRHKWEEMHRHFYILVTTKRAFVGTDRETREEREEPQTVITYKCPCGEYRQVTLEGKIEEDSCEREDTT